MGVGGAARLVGLTIAYCLFCLGSVRAGELTLRFEIHPVINGSRPWDGTGMNSAQMDGGNGGLFGFGSSMLGQMGLDQFNQRIAPPDPYLCFLPADKADLECLNKVGKDTLRYEYRIPSRTAMLRHSWFGIVLVDSDRGNVVGLGDDLIGFGVVLDEETLAKVRSGDRAARVLAANAERKLTAAVTRRFGGTSRSLTRNGASSDLYSAKLSQSKCEYGCTMGDSTLTISTSVDGW